MSDDTQIAEMSTLLGLTEETPAEPVEAEPTDEAPAEPEEKVPEEKGINEAISAKRRALRKLTREHDRMRAELSAWEPQRTQLTADLSALRSGSAEHVIAALGRLTQTDPSLVLEQLVQRAAGQEPSEESRLKARIDALEKRIEREQAQVGERSVQSDLARGVRDEVSFPELARVAAERGHDVVAGILYREMAEATRLAKAGQEPRTYDILVQANHELAVARRSTPATKQDKPSPPKGSRKMPIPTRLAEERGTVTREPMSEDEKLSAVARMLGIEL